MSVSFFMPSNSGSKIRIRENSSQEEPYRPARPKPVAYYLQSVNPPKLSLIECLLDFNR